MIKVITDATNDLNVKFLSDNNIELIPMELTISGNIVLDDKTINSHEFYDGLRKGNLPTTSMINQTIYTEVF